MSRRLWLVLAVVVAIGALSVAALAMRDPGDTESSTGQSSRPATREDGGSSAETSEAPISDAPAGPDDQVSDAIAYELIDALKASGIEPVAGQALTLEYVERLDRVRVSGTFESSELSSVVLSFADGAWQVEK